MASRNRHSVRPTDKCARRERRSVDVLARSRSTMCATVRFLLLAPCSDELSDMAPRYRQRGALGHRTITRAHIAVTASGAHAPFGSRAQFYRLLRADHATVQAVRTQPARHGVRHAEVVVERAAQLALVGAREADERVGGAEPALRHHGERQVVPVDDEHAATQHASEP